MPFILIKGTFHVTGYSPDGDSLKFKANNASNWKKLRGGKVKRNSRGHVQLRFEGIDTPETHYKGQHQPRGVADPATDFAIAGTGITRVTWTENRYRVRSAQDGTAGYILSREAEKFGRPVAFVFSGGTSKPDGSSQFLSPAWVRQSLNYRLIHAGWAYPTYYEGLFSDLREVLSAGAVQAWNAGRGVWPYDWSDSVYVTSQASISQQYCVFPKLFRRLTAHLSAGGRISAFKDFLAGDPDQVLVLSSGHFTHLGSLIDVSGNRVSLREQPENLVFRP